MQKADSNSSAGAKVDSSTKDENLSVSSHDTKPNVVGSPSLSDDEIESAKNFAWAHMEEKFKKIMLQMSSSPSIEIPELRFYITASVVN